MILIADSGSTKTEWTLCDKGQPIKHIVSAGTNPFFQTMEEIRLVFETEVYPMIANQSIEAVYFYGAGCAFPAQKEMVKQAFSPFIKGNIEVESDLIGAARSLCGDKPGIACILGTGSNSCLYDGKQIVRQVSPLGFILGDEGSGAVLGKLLVGDCLKRQLPSDLIDQFMRQYDLTPAILLDRVYKKPFPNRFLAGLSPFLREHITHPAIYSLVYNNFRQFFIRNVMSYSGSDKEPIHFTGSVAYYYKEVLADAAQSLQLTLGKVEQKPMPGLITYHTQNTAQ